MMLHDSGQIFENLFGVHRSGRSHITDRIRGTSNRGARMMLHDYGQIFEDPSGVHRSGRSTLLTAFAAHSIGAPGFEPGTSATRTQRSTGLSHAPKPVLPLVLNSKRGGMGSLREPRRGMSARRASRESPPWPARLDPPLPICCADRRVGSNSSHAAHSKRTGWDSNPRGREPTRFPIVRLKPLGHPSRHARGHVHETSRLSVDPSAVFLVEPGVGWLRYARRSASQIARGFESKNLWVYRKTEGVGFEPTRTVVQRLSRAPP